MLKGVAHTLLQLHPLFYNYTSKKVVKNGAAYGGRAKRAEVRRDLGDSYLLCGANGRERLGICLRVYLLHPLEGSLNPVPDTPFKEHIMNPTPVRPPSYKLVTLGIRKATDSQSKTDVARAVGVSATALGHWRAGRAFPTEPNLRKLARVTGVTVAWLLNGGEDTDYEAAIRAAGVDPASLTAVR